MTFMALHVRETAANDAWRSQTDPWHTMAGSIVLALERAEGPDSERNAITDARQFRELVVVDDFCHMWRARSRKHTCSSRAPA